MVKHSNNSQKLINCLSVFDHFVGLVLKELNYTWLTLKLKGEAPKISIFRSRCSEVLCKKGVLKNFKKSTWKYLCQGLFFDKVADWGNFIKKKTLAQVFSCEFCEIFKNSSSGCLCILDKIKVCCATEEQVELGDHPELFPM